MRYLYLSMCCVLIQGRISVEKSVELLKGMSPSAVDYEIRAISSDAEANDLALLLRLFIQQLSTCRNYELLQSFVNVTLRAHGEVLAEHARYAALLVQLLDEQQKAWARMQALVSETICLVDFCRNAPL